MYTESVHVLIDTSARQTWIQPGLCILRCSCVKVTISILYLLLKLLCRSGLS